MDPVRLGLVVHTFDMGGLERFVAHMLNGLDRRRFQPTLICIRRSGTATEWLRCRDVEIVELHKPDRRGEWSTSGRLATVIRRNRLELLHSHNWGTLLETLLACRRVGGVRHVHAERGTVMGGGRGGWRRKLAGRFMRIALGRCDRVLAVDQAVAERVERSTGFPQSRIEVIPNGVPAPPCADRAAERARVRRELGIPAAAVVLGSVGRLVEVKGFELAIEALSQTTGGPDGPHLVLVGDGPRSAALQSQAQALGLHGRVHFPGRQGDIAPWLAAFDLFLNTSHSEGMSQSILEAMGFGLPLVVSDVGGNAGLVGGADGCGVIVNHRDPTRWARALDDLATNPQARHELAGRAIARHQRDYSLERMIERYSQLYLTLCRGSAAASATSLPG